MAAIVSREVPVESTVTENCLKSVYNATEWSDKPVTVGALAQRLGLSPSSASEHVRKLTDRGLLTHARYGAIELTDEGRRIALRTVRKHRLIEVFLVDYLGYRWDEVHDEAEVLEHAVSDFFVDRLAARLGEPTHDPHGDPIPTVEGTVPDAGRQRLDAIAEGTRVRVARVWDDSPELLRHLAESGIDVGTVLTVVRRQEAAGTLALARDDGAPVVLGLTAAGAIRVSTTFS